LVEDAAAHGWRREIERHQGTIGRLEHLLSDLGEPIEGPEATDWPERGPSQSDGSLSRPCPSQKKARDSVEYVNIMEAARRSAVSDKTIRRAIHKGTLPARFPKANRCEIALSALEHFLPGQVQAAVESRIAALERRVE